MVFVNFNFLYNCPDCFWSYHQGHAWQPISCVKKATPLRLCIKFGITHISITDDYCGSKVIGLGEPPEKSCKAILAAGGAECWFYIIFYLLVGKTNGKNECFCIISRHESETLENVVFLDKRNASDLKRLQSAVGEAMRTEEFTKLCERKLGNTISA